MQSADFVATLFDGRANPAKVTVAFTMALNALQKGHSAMVLLMVEAVELGQPDATAGIDVGKPFEPVPDLLAKFIAVPAPCAFSACACPPCCPWDYFSGSQASSSSPRKSTCGSAVTACF